jgi:mono/diheme cytochrome c family protein
VLAVVLGIAVSAVLVMNSSRLGFAAGPDVQHQVPTTRTGLVLTDANRGQVYFGKFCDSCHTAGREGIGPSLRTEEFKGNYKTVDSIAAVVRKGGFSMPAFSQTLLPDDQLTAIAQYILQLPQE